MIRMCIVLHFILLPYLIFGQEKNRPKLVVGIVVDQMRADYLHRFSGNFGPDGFNRLLEDGFVVKNMHYNYLPTATGPGHASIFTGTTPINHGIVANDWYSRQDKKIVYCTLDDKEVLVDGESKTHQFSMYSRSPRNLLSTTITDELKLSSNGRSKIIGISLKDRGSILPAGHMADFALWFNTHTGNFITSSYYSKSLPTWLKNFNKRKIADSILNLTWEAKFKLSKYQNSGTDNQAGEKTFIGKEGNSFPYNLRKLRKDNGNFGLIPQIPFGNTLLTKLAINVITNEHMGIGKETDFLTISYSSTDYVGHNFGIRSKELEDTYVRLDAEIETLLSFLDSKIGENNYLLFLTADHGASDNPNFLKKSRLSGESLKLANIKEELNRNLSKKFGYEEWVIYLDKTQVYLKYADGNRLSICEEAIKILKDTEGIKQVYLPSTDQNRHFGVDSFFKKSFNIKRSGDILFHLEEGWMPERKYGTTHGTAYNSDTHVPMIWYGKNIRQGRTYKKYSIDQIASTLSFLLNIPLPSSANKEPIIEVLKRD
ncbi:hypothetical protein BFP77_13965 [Maribacter sp. 4U21]|uniref:alkaline phosphatase family protein n=1 Tax=Maribacter sp. 4U21 TaxID=1889779 RepID=UPI000C148A2E|nr:alkaline phosphatase family protein [Maribacter sp. 4U21]PIB27134.1 hypothetical protein BFP77_13965 [Maribacter sp. 4U21]